MLKNFVFVIAVLIGVLTLVSTPANAGNSDQSSNVKVDNQATFCPQTLQFLPTFDFAVNAIAAGGRTCRCSCGQPCRTDADCGPGGQCRGGISCCAAPTGQILINSESSSKEPAPTSAITDPS